MNSSLISKRPLIQSAPVKIRTSPDMHAVSQGLISRPIAAHATGQETRGVYLHVHRPGVQCPACEDARREILESTPFAERPFEQAAPLWLKEHSRYIKPRTVRDYTQYLKSLSSFFEGITLRDIHIGMIRSYQDQRGAKASNGKINMELSALQQMLKEAKLWPSIAEMYRPLPISSRGAGRSASKEDQQKLLDIAFSKPRRRLAAHCVRIMLLSGVGFGELSRVKRQDVDLRERTFEIVEGAKNKERERTIPLTDQAFESMLWIIDRFEFLGGRPGSDYILPHCSSKRNGPRDFNRPMGSLKKAWGGIRQDAIKEIGPHMAKFRLYDCRVTAVTKALASGKVSIHTAEKLFGHVSQAMQRRYYKPAMSVLRTAVDVLGDKETA